MIIPPCAPSSSGSWATSPTSSRSPPSPQLATRSPERGTSLSGDDLCQAIRAVARGQPAFPPVPPTAVSALATGLDVSDVPILGMLVQHGHLGAEIADAPASPSQRSTLAAGPSSCASRHPRVNPRRPRQPSAADRSKARPALAHHLEHGAMRAPSACRAERAPRRPDAREGAPQTTLATTGRPA